MNFVKVYVCHLKHINYVYRNVSEEKFRDQK